MTLDIHQLVNRNETSTLKISTTQLLKMALKKIGQIILQFLIAKREPHIVRRVDKQGYPYWEIYDAASDQTYCCLTETEVLIWLETRYY